MLNKYCAVFPTEAHYFVRQKERGYKFNARARPRNIVRGEFQTQSNLSQQKKKKYKQNKKFVISSGFHIIYIYK